MMRVRNHNCQTLFVLAAAAAALLPVPTAHAAAYTYSTRQRTINAGILLLDDTDSTGATISGMGEGPSPAQIAQGADDPDPYVFFVLNQRNDLKPFGWNIVNPLAPPNVTSSILTRWNARTANASGGSAFLAVSGGSAYTLNQHITPNMAPYWEVPLAGQTNLDTLLQFDVLLLNLRGHTASLTSKEAEMLRRFVDGGGQLWVEDSGGGQMADPLFLDFKFNPTAQPGSALLPVAIGTPTLQRHPVIDSPYQLTLNELNSLGSTANGINYTITGTTNFSTAPDTTLLSTVAADGGDPARLPIIAAGQLGAGQIIVTTTGSSATINDAVGGIDAGYGPNSGPFSGSNYAAAPTADLKFVVDLLSWDTAHPNELKTSHQSSQSRSNLGPAVTPIWNYGLTALTGVPPPPPPPGAVINGDYAYVRGADGFLHAFNTQPGTDILGTGMGTPDAGYPDFINGYSYDELWDSSGKGFSGVAPIAVSGPYTSAPTVATIPTGQTLVFVEDANGAVYAADAITGKPYTNATGVLPVSNAPATVPTPYGPTTGPAPSPTYYGGRIYAGQPDGNLYVYDFNSTGSASVGIRYQFTASTTEAVIAAPTVGIVRDTVNGVQVDDIVAAVSTNMGVYTVMLGARHDYPSNSAGTLVPAPAGVAGSPGSITPDMPNATYFSETNGYPMVVSSAGPFTPPTQYFADYDVTWAASPPSPNYLNRIEFAVNPQASGSYTYTPAAATSTSAPALGSNGNLYYTANLPTSAGLNSTLVCAHDVRQTTFPNPSNRLNWRFRLPYSNEAAFTDVDGNSYSALNGFQFQGAPVVDAQGNVFALAVKGSQTAILCFNGNQAVSVLAVPPALVPAGDTTTVTSMTQPLPGGGTTDEFGGTPPQAIQSAYQFNATPDVNGYVTLNNFGFSTTNSPYVSPNVAEPQPVSVSYQFNPPNPPGGPSSPPQINPVAPMYTNMAWYALLPSTSALSPTAGITLVGNYLFYGDSSGNVCRLYAYPQTSGLIGANRAVNVGGVDNSGHPVFAVKQTVAGSIGGAPSAGGDVMVVNGANGVVALGSQYTLIADSNRILEADSDGVASWAVDATTQTTASGTQTHLELTRPSSVFQLAPNDYLVADTGNNRCVRFDRSGKTLWELTRFNDYADATTNTLFNKSIPLLTPGEPTTLNHPTSVQSYQTFVHDSSNNVIGTVIHYLIADTGNYRILEVVDAFDKNGNPVGAQHNLVWLSHTYDVQQRRYQYTSPSYFTGPDGTHYVAALIANERLKTPLPAIPGQLNASTTDSPGSSLVLLYYDPGSTVGLVAASASYYYAYLQSGQFDINGAPKLTSAGVRSAATGTLTQVYLRNPRFLQTYTPPGGTGALQNFLLADDNGVFDLFLNTSVTPHRFETQWGFTQADYKVLQTLGSVSGSPAMVLAPVDLFTPALMRANLGFLPTSIQRVGTETVSDSTGSYLMGHYIVANGFSTGEVTPTTGFGGEALELNDIPDPANSNQLVTEWYSSFSKPGSTASQAGNTAPLSQPTYAVREK